VPSNQRATPGTIIGGRYQLRAAIGNGGMGTVWQAVDTVLRRDVAVKEVLLPPGMPVGERTAMYERTLREGRAAAALSHPSVVQVYDVVTENGRPWIIMELLQARSLSEIIISDGPLAGRAVAKIGIALLGALEVAHAAGVLHRDVKPANVLICADGRCVLTDFGVARMPSESNLTQPGMVLGSPHFISPERAIGAPFGPPSDLFSLGVTLYTAAEGRPPFDRGDPFDTMRAIVEDQPAPTQRSGVLTPVLMGLLDKDPEKRWTVAEARKALRDLTNGALTNRAATQPTERQNVMPVAQPTPPTAEHAEPGRLGGRALLGPGESIGERLASRPSVASSADLTRPDGSGLEATSDALSTAPLSGSPGGAASIRGAAVVRPPSDTNGRDIFDGARRMSVQGMAAVRGWSKGAKYATAAVVVLVVAAILVTAVRGIGRGSASPNPTTSATTAAPPFAVQSFDNGRGIVVQVPQDWKETKPRVGSYVDFLDPANSGRKVRVNVEPSGNDPREFLGVAEHGLQRGSCKGYQRVDMTDITLDGHAAAQLEYTCGSGDTGRHGIWAAATIGGKAYEFYLTVPERDFASSKPIYDQMVSSVKLTPTN
jgi:eukaryotic-like serine/threonine-protein kinase